MFLQSIAENNIDTHFTKNRASIYRVETEIARAGVCRKLYYICATLEVSIEQVEVAVKLNQQKTKASSAETNLLYWHQQLGHADINAVQKLFRKSLAIGAIENLKATSHMKDERCVDRIVRKIPRLPFKAEANTTTTILQLAYIDLCGPMQATSIGGNRYFLIITDAYSRMRHVYFLKSKDLFQKLFGYGSY
jgi:hypothetical protein